MPRESVKALAGENAEKLSRNGGLYKVVTRPGSERRGRPPPGAKVRVHYTGRLTDGTVFDSSRDRPGYFVFTLGRGQVIRGWDIGIASMQRGEVATLTCRDDYAYGESGFPPKIPPQATLKFDVELFGWQENENRTLPSALVCFALLAATIAFGAWVMDMPTTMKASAALAAVSLAGAVVAARRQDAVYAQRSIDEAMRLKELGGEAFGKGEWIDARDLYADAVEATEELVLDPRDAQTPRFQQAMAVLTSCLLNQASCALKLSDWHAAVWCCTRVLYKDAECAKAWYRRAHARIELREFESASKDLREALRLEPASTEVRAMWERCREAEAAEKKSQAEKERGMYRNMFRSAESDDPPP